MNNKFLPIGSVVLLHGGRKKLMITGFCVALADKESKVYDYSGCIYPEGIITSGQTCMFDHSDIEQIYFTGYIDEEEKQFKDKLNDIVAKLNN